MKKGFTLIELLAVILILGIISLIAIPVVTNILEEAKKSSFKTSVVSILTTAENKCSTDHLEEKKIDYLYEIKNNNITPSLDIKGSLPTSGYILMDSNCNGKMVNISNGKYFVNSEDENVEVTDVAKKSELADIIIYLYYIIEPDVNEISLENISSKNLSIGEITGMGTNENNKTLFSFSGYYTKNMDIENANKILERLNERLKTDDVKEVLLDGYKYYIDYDNKQIIFYGNMCKYLDYLDVSLCNGEKGYLETFGFTSESQFYAFGGQKIIVR